MDKVWSQIKNLTDVYDNVAPLLLRDYNMGDIHMVDGLSITNKTNSYIKVIRVIEHQLSISAR